MLAWLQLNLGTVVVVLALLLIVALAVWKLLKNKRTGQTSCGCGGEHCALRDKCHPTKE